MPVSLQRMPSIKAGMENLQHAAQATRDTVVHAASATKEKVSDVGWSFSNNMDKLNKWGAKSNIGRIFGFKERRTRLTGEIRAGTITFLMVAYILAVNPQILGTTGGTCYPQDLCSPESYDSLGAQCLYEESNPAAQDCLEEFKLNLITATAASSCISCFVIGYFANLPLALAPGMGINAYVAYQVVGPLGQGGLTYSQAMTAIFVEGWIFILLSLTGIRGGIIKHMPSNISFAASVGIGLLLAFTGLRNLGVVVFDPNTIVSLGGCTESYQDHVYVTPLDVFTAPVVNSTELVEGSVYSCRGGEMRSASMWLGISGGVITAVLLARHVKGALFIGIAFVTVISWIPGHAASYLGEGSVIPGGEKRLDTFKNVVAAPSLSLTGLAWDWSAFDSSHLWVALFTFLYIDLLDCTGTLLSMASLLDDVMTEDAYEEGALPGKPFLSDEKEFHGQMWAFLADGLGIVTGSMMGVTPLTVYIESAAGIEDGGRTGLTAIVVSFFFFVALFFSPILAAIPPYATGPALVLVGLYLIAHVDRISWDDHKKSVPAFLTIIIMPFTLSVAYGIIAGLAAYVILNVPPWAWQHGKQLYREQMKKRRRSEEGYDDSEQHSPARSSPAGSIRHRRRRHTGQLPRKDFSGTLGDLRRSSSVWGSDDGNHSVHSHATNDSYAMEAMERAGIIGGAYGGGLGGSSPVAIRGGLRRTQSHAGMYDAGGTSAEDMQMQMQGRSLAEYQAAMVGGLQRQSSRNNNVGSNRGLRRMSSASAHGGERSKQMGGNSGYLNPRTMTRSRTFTELSDMAATGRGGHHVPQGLDVSSNRLMSRNMGTVAAAALAAVGAGAGSEFKLFGDVSMGQQPDPGSDFKLFGDVSLPPEQQQQQQQPEPSGFKLFGDVELPIELPQQEQEQQQQQSEFKLFGEVTLPQEPPATTLAGSSPGGIVYSAPASSTLLADAVREEDIRAASAAYVPFSNHAKPPLPESSGFKLFGDVQLPVPPHDQQQQQQQQGEEDLGNRGRTSPVPHIEGFSSVERAPSGNLGGMTYIATPGGLIRTPSFQGSGGLDTMPGGLTHALSSSQLSGGEGGPSLAPKHPSLIAQQPSINMSTSQSSGAMSVRVSLADGMGSGSTSELASPFLPQSQVPPSPARIASPGFFRQNSMNNQPQSGLSGNSPGLASVHSSSSMYGRSGGSSPSRLPSSMSASQLLAAQRLKGLFSESQLDKLEDKDEGTGT